MEQPEFLVPDDITFHPFTDLTSESSIKREELKDDDILLFAHLDTITNNIANSSDYQIVQEVEMVGQLKDRMDVVSNALEAPYPNKINMGMDDDPLTPRLPENHNTSHYVRYKLLDGKHVKIWECGICSKEFTHQYTLMRHLPTHTDERKFQCNTCGKGNLRNHVFTHTNERPYKCDICEKGFNQMSNLMCHKLKAHQRAEKPKYVCQICGKCFLKRMGLRHHEQYTHGMVTQPVSAPQIPEKLR